MGINLSVRPSGGEGGYADDGRITSAPLRNEAISVLASQRSTHIITSEMLAGAGHRDGLSTNHYIYHLTNFVPFIISKPNTPCSSSSCTVRYNAVSAKR